jgi:predicted metalloendopeptidase
MTHGFDDQGAKFDPEGNLRNWWTAKDLENFHNSANCIIKQYGAWNVEENLNLNGELVTGEAIADLGGATLALRAYQKSLETSGRTTIDGVSSSDSHRCGRRTWLPKKRVVARSPIRMHRDRRA